MRVLAITKIFPNSKEPLSSPFNRQQLAALSKRCELEVLATIPWFPGAAAFKKWSPAGRLTEVPSVETIDGLTVHHPRFAYVPKGGLSMAGALYAASLLPEALRRRGRFDVVLGTWAYPDGFAAVALAKAMGLPVAIKLHGSDINVLGQRPEVKGPIGWGLSRADAVVSVSKALGDAAIALGARPDRTHVVLNGVDKSLFHPRDRAEARQRLGEPATGEIVLYVGRLEQAKGALDLIEAFARVAKARPSARLVMVGDGSARAACEEAAAKIGPQVKLTGPLPHAQVTSWMAACDLLSLPSWNEGTPNVVIEALASGRRVVASDVGGIPALLHHESLGALVPARDAAALAAALEKALGEPYDPDAVAERSGLGGWDDSAKKLEAVLARVVDERRTRAHYWADARRTPGPAPSASSQKQTAAVLQEDRP